MSFVSQAEKTLRRVSTRSDDHEDQDSQKSGNSSTGSNSKTKQKRKKRVSLVEAATDSFKSMISSPVTRSPSARSSGVFSTGGRSSDEENAPRSPLSTKSSSGVAAMLKGFLDGTKDTLEISKFDFEDAITILGTEESIRKFHKIFFFKHRLDEVKMEEDELEFKFGSTYEFMNNSKKKSTKIKLSKITETSDLFEIVNTLKVIKQHSFVFIYDDEMYEENFKTWLNIIANVGLSGNIILLFDKEEEKLLEKTLSEKMKNIEEKVSDIFIESYIKAVSVDYSSEEIYEEIEKTIQRCLM